MSDQTTTPEFTAQPVEKCDTDCIVQKMEGIKTLKDLRQHVAEGITKLPVTVEDITAAIESERRELEEAIAKCGSMEGIPEQAIDELSEAIPEAAMPELELLPGSVDSTSEVNFNLDEGEF